MSFKKFGTGKSVMKHQFSETPKANIQRSTFNRSHGYKTALDAGYLVPFLVDECLPGDTFKVRSTLFGRLATPITPIMDNLFLDTFYFAVPIRLLWENWERFNGAQDDPEDSTDYLVPVVNSEDGFAANSLSDYFGLPVGVANIEVCAFWHRAYNLIWNEWFRDQNLQDSAPVPTGPGPNTMSDFPLRRRGKRHDYFTSCLPWPQKGPGIELPLAGHAPVYGTGNIPVGGTGKALGLSDGIHAGGIKIVEQNLRADEDFINMNVGTSPSTFPGETLSGTGAVGVTANPANSGLHAPFDATDYGLYADIGETNAITINSMREAFQLQKLLERDARGGTRYTEVLASHFGVTSPDARLQRPEYLGGSSTRINVTPVAQTSATDSQPSPSGSLSGFGLVNDQKGGFVKSFTEHCVIIGLCNVRADLTYQQGIPRMFSRQTRFDFYWPALAHLGEQPVLNKEIYCQGTSADDDVFGYQERYAEYRYKPSQITGQMRSTHATSLDVWHLSQEFETLPTLSDSFIQDNPPIDRVIAVPSEPHIILDCYIQMSCVRPMPTYGVPGFN